MIENFRRSSADGLSLAFLIIWLLGDVSNVLGSVLQGVLPTMTILAIYYVAADFVLLGQCFYYRGSGSSGRAAGEGLTGFPTEQSPLLGRETASDVDPQSRRSFVDLESPSDGIKPTAPQAAAAPYPSPPTTPLPVSTSPSISSLSAIMVSVFYKVSAVLLVCSVGTIGWYLSSGPSRSHDASSKPHVHPAHPDPSQDSALRLNLWGQIFGYLCAASYLGSRVPQLLLNHSRKSTEGVSILFFIFCCIGNVSYTLSIFAYSPPCAGSEKARHEGLAGQCENGDWQRAYWRYILVDASWIAGSVGTFALDLAIFAQFWLYRGKKRRAGIC